MQVWSREFAGRPECLPEARRFVHAALGSSEITFEEVTAISGTDGPAVGLPRQERAKRKVGMTTDEWTR